MSRRGFLKAATVMALAAATGPVLAACGTSQPQPRGYDGEPRPLPIPPLDEGKLVDGHRHFTLTTQAGSAEILPGTTTSTWGFNGDFLGPTLRMHRGDDVEVDITNELDEMTTIHWHGMKLPAWADGGPHSPIEPGETWSPRFGVDQPAATLWYHPHPHGRTRLHCYRGLAGLLLIDDDVSDNLDLPHEYGVDDIPVVIMDHKFTDDGELDETLDDDLGLMGDTPVVNGITNARFDAETSRVRFRIVNGANMRFYNLALSDERAFSVVATDSGLLSEPHEVTHALIGPGERLEIVVDLEPEEEISLVSLPLEGNFGIPEDNDEAPDFGFQHEFEFLQITGPAEGTPASAALPAELDPAAAEQPNLDGVIEREFALNTFEINGETMDMERVDVTIDHQDPEVWIVTNENPDWPHNFHIHNSRFRVLSIDNNEVEEIGTYGWKDTVSLPPGATARLAVEFGYYPDPTVPYMYHCHMLWHEDNGMMGQFVIVEPGEEAALEPMSGHGPH
ncbi:copper oxidase [Corynebacterium yudongzhengii]|uniref:Multicopper oxidase CueO n=1 Tax=Corynebacterium yudongzhengii TaxID=2080740 RepID=A0A2U1T6T4_9CORY|nr:multicopper oxidase domain-containing protein [Corynebacterium yudongzhengii]AWB82253.1 copper oxidase [Corynebacterium yudongzhengii]PWC01702.1 copper oxidase [Corynebacterium yudongzhengii]